MFLKKYKVKTCSTIKGSERKKLRSLVEAQYPTLSFEELDTILSSKHELNQTKILVHSGSTVILYYSGATPMFFLNENRLFPTVYTLWKFPHILPTIPTVPPVMEKLSNGADLMAPGIIIDEETIEEFKNLELGKVCCIRIDGNKSAIAVGIALMTREEIMTEGIRGKAVQVLHCYKDFLWSSGDQTSLPIVDESTVTQIENLNIDNHNEVNENIEFSNTDSTQEDTNVPENCEEHKSTENVSQYSMDDLLNQCLLFALKINAKKLSLPLLTSTFYRTYLMSCCPSQFTLDIKKSSHKKLSVFLKSEWVCQFLQVKELSKGVESIVSINTEHEAIQTFTPDIVFREHRKQQKAENVVEDTQVQDNYKFPEINEVFAVSAQVKEIFESLKYRKGDILSQNTIRQALREYVKVNELQDTNNPRMVILDPVLANKLLKKGDSRSTISWEDLYTGVTRLMSPAFTVAFEGEEEKLKKGHIESIDVSVATRTGNKKVTLISNLENFGIKPEKLANHIQIAVAASTSVASKPNGKGMQLLIQGNHLRYLQTLFSDVYKVPKKYIRGLENVPAKKKK